MSFKEGAATPLSPLQARKLADQKRAEADDEAQSPKPRSPRTADQGLAFDSALSTGDWVRDRELHSSAQRRLEVKVRTRKLLSSTSEKKEARDKKRAELNAKLGKIDAVVAGVATLDDLKDGPEEEEAEGGGSLVSPTGVSQAELAGGGSHSFYAATQTLDRPPAPKPALGLKSLQKRETPEKEPELSEHTSHFSGEVQLGEGGTAPKSKPELKLKGKAKKMQEAGLDDKAPLLNKHFSTFSTEVPLEYEPAPKPELSVKGNKFKAAKEAGLDDKAPLLNKNFSSYAATETPEFEPAPKPELSELSEASAARLAAAREKRAAAKAEKDAAAAAAAPSGPNSSVGKKAARLGLAPPSPRPSASPRPSSPRAASRSSSPRGPAARSPGKPAPKPAPKPVPRGAGKPSPRPSPAR